jgi:NitT/TauT family transport system substrate-binding protein
MKKILGVFALVLLVVAPAFSQAAYENQKDQSVSGVESVSVNLAVMAGPTGFGSAALSENDGRISDTLIINTKVYSSPTEVIAQIAKGTEDIAALPSNLAAVLYNKGLKIKLAAVIGNGMLSVVSSSIQNPIDLVGEQIYIPGGPASSPNQLAKLIINDNGLSEDDFTLEYGITSSAQLSQLLIAEKAKTALLPEPFVTMVLSKNSNVKKIYDAQDGYKVATGVDNYPMTVLVVQDEFAQNHPEALKEFLAAYKDSVAFVVANPKDAGQLIENLGIMKASMATPAIPNCNLTYVSAQDAMKEINEYYQMLFNFNPASVGGTLLPAEFYL